MFAIIQKNEQLVAASPPRHSPSCYQTFWSTFGLVSDVVPAFFFNVHYKSYATTCIKDAKLRTRQHPCGNVVSHRNGFARALSRQRISTAEFELRLTYFRIWMKLLHYFFVRPDNHSKRHIFVVPTRLQHLLAGNDASLPGVPYCGTFLWSWLKGYLFVNAMLLNLRSLKNDRNK